MILAKPAFPHKFGPYQMISQQVNFCYKAVVTAVNSMTELKAMWTLEYWRMPSTAFLNWILA